MPNPDIENMRATIAGVTEGVTPLRSVDDPGLDHGGWAPQVLTPHNEQEEPTLLRVRGAGCLIYPGKTHLFQGETESGKTWLALVAAVEVLEAGGRVLWVDYEDTARTLAGRLWALRVDPALWARVDYINPTGPLRGKDGVAHTGGAAHLAGLLRANTYGLAVIDGLSVAMGVEGLDMNSANDVGAFYGRLPNVLAAHGASVLLLTHVTKNAETRGKYALGSQAWNSNVSGAAYGVEVRRSWSRAKLDPVEGLVHVKVAKDRPGGVASTGTVVASVQVISTPDGCLEFRLRSPEDVVEVPPMPLVRAILDHVRTYPGASGSDIESHVSGKAEIVRAAKKWLVSQKLLTVEHVGRGHRHYVDESVVEAQGY